MKRCIFLLTGDLHGNLSEEAAAHIETFHQEDENTLLLDAGDAVEAGNLDVRRPKDPILKRMSSLGYDAMVMGNRESHPFQGLLERKLADADFPILAANLMAKRRPAPAKIKSHILRKMPNEIRVAVIGLAPQMTAPESWWSRVTHYVFDSPEKTAAGLAKKLRGEADILVILSHCGMEMDRKLAKLEGIDLLLGGHSHTAVYMQNDGAPILHSGYLGRNLARAEVIYECGKKPRIEAKLIPLSEPEKAGTGERQ